MKIRNLFVATTLLVVIGFVAEQSMAQRPNNLFSQYYTHGAAQVHAEMYPAPHPVPRHVGQSYYTYQPLMPHEMMYAHRRDYYNYYATPASFYSNLCGGHPRGGYGVTKTTVRWQHGCSHIMPLPGVTLPFSRLNHHWSRHQSVPRGPINSLMSCQGGGCLSKLLSGGGLGGNYGSSESGFEGGYGIEGDYYGEGECVDCESYATNWQQASQQAAARAAAAMQQRYHR